MMDADVSVASIARHSLVSRAATVRPGSVSRCAATHACIWRLANGSSLLETLVFLPMIVPEVILGVSLLILFVTIGGFRGAGVPPSVAVDGV